MLHFKLILFLLAFITVTVGAGDVCDYTQAPLYRETTTTRRESLCKDVPPEIECTVEMEEEQKNQKRQIR
ncbi:Protein CBG26932 [Caenorhabditis briggsae]|nr:Protein CBG26932 [Caenorhabditis briggsae]CAR99263.1 Protein CBG26932 [Caenorhabditis briggsae]